MRLIDILKPENIKVPLESTNKNGAIAELVNLLAKSGDVTDAKRVLDAVLERESTRTTIIPCPSPNPRSPAPACIRDGSSTKDSGATTTCSISKAI